MRLAGVNRRIRAMKLLGASCGHLKLSALTGLPELMGVLASMRHDLLASLQ